MKPDYHAKNKLLYHDLKVNQWLEGKNPFPIMVDMDLTNACNHLCPHCVGSKNQENENIPVLDSNKHIDNTTVNFEVAKRRIDEFRDVGVQSMIFGGGGDPTIHPRLAELIRYVKNNGIEIAVNTNGTKISDEVRKAMVDSCTWVRISIDADGPQMYKLTHGVGEKAWYGTIENIGALVKTRNERDSNEPVIGLTYLVAAHTVGGIYNASKLARELGVNYIRFRPFFNWGGERNIPEDAAEKAIVELEKSRELNSDNFEVNYPEDRIRAMNQISERKHKKCYIPQFVTSISAGGYLAPCCLMKGNPAFMSHGDLNKNNFKEVWQSEERRKAYDEIDFKYCPAPCMQEKNNEVLWEMMQEFLAHGRKQNNGLSGKFGEHINFL